MKISRGKRLLKPVWPEFLILYEDLTKDFEFLWFFHRNFLLWQDFSGVVFPSENIHNLATKFFYQKFIGVRGPITWWNVKEISEILFGDYLKNETAFAWTRTEFTRMSLERLDLWYNQSSFIVSWFKATFHK